MVKLAGEIGVGLVSVAKLVWVEIDIDMVSLRRVQKTFRTKNETKAIEHVPAFVITDGEPGRLPDTESNPRMDVSDDNRESQR
jgi:hypothetical protein